jgi:hypothetical protein
MRIAYISARRETETPVVRAVNDAARVCGGSVVRFEEFGLPGQGNDWSRFLQSADIVVAHVRQLNPNLLFEIGIAHGLGKPVVFITPASLKLPIDLRGQRTVSYEDKPDAAKLTFALTEWLQELQRVSSLGQSVDVVRRPSESRPRIFISHSSTEFFETAVAEALSSVPGWEVHASNVEDRDGGFDFIIWNQQVDSTLAALGNPIGVEVKSIAPSMEIVRRLVENTQKQGLKSLLLIVQSRLPQKFRRSVGSLGNRSGIAVLAFDQNDIESIDSPGGFTRSLRRSLIDLRLA